MPVAYPVFSLDRTQFTPGRLRLRVPEMRRDREFFSAVKERVSRVEGVLDVKVNRNTSSFLVLHDEEVETLLNRLEQTGLFQIATKEELRHFRDESGLTKFTREETLTLKAAFFTSLALLQAVRGFPIGPSTTLLKQATGYWNELQARKLS